MHEIRRAFERYVLWEETGWKQTWDTARAIALTVEVTRSLFDAPSRKLCKLQIKVLDTGVERKQGRWPGVSTAAASARSAVCPFFRLAVAACVRNPLAKGWATTRGA